MHERQPVTQEMLDEALRLGSDSVSKANRYMTAIKVLVDGAERTLQLLDTGRINQARDHLRNAVASIHSLLKEPKCR